ncbi:preprotein translocase subunit SecG [Candidatus Pantoea edessiphila]|uniref:Protein-export membrane protein SecG n=1 Tax=Candidatus Pantoea edessiphila TaxID=2044610 RepID=A0A2P5SY77_9GAMM|nr:preprotein translocase subunit SecG [Candidatus Pantoea edessiphila]MBK4775640.1 preprotein translocase subunit SecG [Pantoea sp. Edef]PPI87286.1 preprotein translocase subunit SecG [Candidatus Pantoea edessiphila]
MYLFLLISLFIVCIMFISLVMLQQNKGAGIETSFNSNRSSMLFSSISSDSFLNRIIAILAVLFFLIILILNNFNNNMLTKSKWENLSIPPKNQKISSK